MLSSHFSKVVCISMPHHKDRRDNIKKQFLKSQLYKDLTFFDGVIGVNIDIRLIGSNIITDHGRLDIIQKTQKHYGVSLTYGALGCALSHYLLYKECIKETKPFLIFEDDIRLHDNFDSHLMMIMHEIRAHNLMFDICYLGLHNIPSLKKINNVTEHLCKPEGLMCGTFGMIVTPRAAEKILKYVFPLSIQIDSSISNKKHMINIIASKTDIVIHNHVYGSYTQKTQGCLNNNG